MKQGVVTFSWRVAYNYCSIRHFKIESDCGSCVSISDTDLTNVLCSIEEIAPATEVHVCTFAVRSVVCGNITSELSNQIEVILKGIIIIVLAVSHARSSDN